ncbi:MAG TPA: chorismate-binding protein, partial [Flavobacteriales bacterium]|nr:chorismate-binding protein [Flavobacteriales bacterium]
MEEHGARQRSWSGAIAWSALAPYRHFLARRVADEDRWWVLVSVEGSAVRDAPDLSDGAWWYGHIGYDEKNVLEALHSRHAAHDGFAQHAWRRADIIIELGAGAPVLHARGGHVPEGERLLQALIAPEPALPLLPAVTWQRRTPRERYLEQVGRLLQHIHRGDIYEVNYCTQRTAELRGFDPYAAFTRLMQHSDAPFAGFYRDGDRYALCASPERFLRIKNGLAIAQPMKGTRPRSADLLRDAALAHELATDPKERSENIMALDVSRNDL